MLSIISLPSTDPAVAMLWGGGGGELSENLAILLKCVFYPKY